MKKIIIQENQKGLLFKNGKYLKMLGTGKYWTLGGKSIEVVDLDASLTPKGCKVETLLADPAVAAETVVCAVTDGQLALHYADGQLVGILRAGKHVFWKTAEHTFQTVDLSSCEVDPSIPSYVFTKIPTTYFYRVEIAEHQKGRLFLNKKPVALLDAGVYYYWRTADKLEYEVIDTRLSRLEVTGQELLTADKVALRVSFLCNYRVTDCERIFEIDDFREQLRLRAQLALREYVGKYKLDEILESKDQMTEFVLSKLKEREAAFFVEVTDAGVRDIILPGEIREIMNTVLVAEKRAQANVITRREEVASTRSLLNTAKLMEENPTLYKLKELEYVERICENVGNINLSGNGDLLSQLVTLLRAGGTAS